MSVEKFVLPNGVRVLVEPVEYVRSAAIGLWCKTGSRHENDDEAGITHLIEHMLFKGTKKRTAMQIAQEIEGRGGSLNAFTDKESTCYYCRVLSDDIDNGVDVLSDMMLNSLIEPDELEREEQVVLEEIKRSEDEPGDHVHELHLEHRWGSHPLGKPIIGTKESVAGFKPADIFKYMKRQYRGSNIVLSITGKVEAEAFRTLAESKLGGLEPGGVEVPCSKPAGKANRTEVSKDVEQVHFCMGTEGCGIFDDELYTLSVLDAALGGSMSSRLFQEIREKRGLAYSVGSYQLSYTAGGAFTVYGGTSPKHWTQVQELTFQEIEKVKSSGLEPDELERTKRNICGNIVLALEGMSGRMMRNSRNEMHHGREVPIEETMTKIDAVTNPQLVELANKLLTTDLISITAIGPF